jgi:TorA maturation chaperone TorD
MSENEAPTQEQINAGLAQALQKQEQSLKEITEYLKQAQTAQQPQQNDPSDQPITIRTLLAELPNFINLYRQTQTPPSDPMQSVYLEFGRKVVGDTLEQVSKNVFAKPIAKIQTENIKNATQGTQ